jgi:preprotein translocase subunit SecG
MYTLITILIILACALLSFAVLIQNAKGGGLAAGFSASTQIMGVRKTTDFLEKFTWGLIIALFSLSLIGNFMLPKQEIVQESSAIQEQIDNSSLPSGSTPPPPPAGN